MIRRVSHERSGRGNILTRSSVGRLSAQELVRYQGQRCAVGHDEWDADVSAVLACEDAGIHVSEGLAAVACRVDSRLPEMSLRRRLDQCLEYDLWDGHCVDRE